MSKYNLYKYSIDGRYGDVSGMFIATPDDVDALIGQTVCFGDILGKHSDVSHTFRRADIVKVKVNDTTILDLAGQITEDDIVGGTTTISGVNPFKYIYRYFKCNTCNTSGVEYELDVDEYEGTMTDMCPSCNSTNLKFDYKEFDNED